MEKLLKIYTYVDGENDKPFLPSMNTEDAENQFENQIEILDFSYDAKRMGSAPTIAATIMHPQCLDKEWTGKEYVKFNGENFFLKQTPTSSKNNTDVRYKHDVEFVSERSVLDHTVFREADSNNSDSEVAFFGGIREFVDRLNKVLSASPQNRYTAVVDENQISENQELFSQEKFIKFSKLSITGALQEAYEQYEIPYYFVGTEIHFGFSQSVVEEIFKYGVKNELLSVAKTNANKDIVNRCTGTGSGDNLQYFYPNEHPIGDVTPLYNNVEGSIAITDKKKFSDKVKLSTVLTYKDDFITPVGVNFRYYNQADYDKWVNIGGEKGSLRSVFFPFIWPFVPINKEAYVRKYEDPDYAENIMSGEPTIGSYKGFNPLTEHLSFSKDNPSVAVLFNVNIDGVSAFDISATMEAVSEERFGFKFEYYDVIEPTPTSRLDIPKYSNPYYLPYTIGNNQWKRRHDSNGLFCVIITCTNASYLRESILAKLSLSMSNFSYSPKYNWHNEKGSIVELDDYGISYNGLKKGEDEITFTQTEEQIANRMQFKDVLMPSVYRKSKGSEIFYNAKNYPFECVDGYIINAAAGEYEKMGYVHNDLFINPTTGKYYKFANEYNVANSREGSETFEDVKPSLANFRNGFALPINQFLDIAYDKNDNDEVGEDGKYIHPYFFVKLRKTNGNNGFNLFSQASEQGEMTISMTSGDCGACNFVVGVHEDTKKNIVQVYEEDIIVKNGSQDVFHAMGSLKRDDNGNVLILAGNPQDIQNDTQNNEVWLALRKDNTTYPHIMPNATFGVKPSTEDTFVFTNIIMPEAYIMEAEEELSRQIIKYMHQNNGEKFTFSIKFSRIYLEENPNILAQLNENAIIPIEYNGYIYNLYVDSFAYKMRQGEVLPEVVVELNESIISTRNSLDTILSNAKDDIVHQVQEMDITSLVAKNFLSKNEEDSAAKKINFKQGWSVGIDEQKSYVDEDGNSTFENVTVKKSVSTHEFADGFAGSGFKLWQDENGKTKLTVDDLTIRETFRVFEMLVSKIRAVNGGLFISAANGVIANVETVAENKVDYYYITFEEQNMFIVGDYMRCQVLNGISPTSWWVEVLYVDGLAVKALKSEFGNAEPKIGQEVVLCGSKNKNRQNAIHISATEDGQPRIDILNNISTKSFDGCLRTRLGNLDGITDEYFGDNQPKGDGLYGDNVFLKGEFHLKKSGKDVETLFSVQDGKITSMVEQTMTTTQQGQTFLYNPSFAKGFDGWIVDTQIGNFFTLGGNIIVNGEKALAKGVTRYSEPVADNIFAANIKNGWIKQLHTRFVGVPEVTKENISEGEEATEKKYPLFFSVYIRCKVQGNLLVKVGENIIYDQDVLPSSVFALVSVDNATWNGNGDFFLSFTNDNENAEADIYGLTLYTNSVEMRYGTLFEQSATLIELSAFAKDDRGNIIKLSELKQTVEGFETTVTDYENQVSVFQQTVEGFKTTVTDCENQVSVFQQTVEGFETTVTGNNEKLDELTNSVNGFDDKYIKTDALDFAVEEILKDKDYVVDTDLKDYITNATISNYSTTEQTKALINSEVAALSEISVKQAEYNSALVAVNQNISNIKQTAYSITQTVSESFTKNILVNGLFTSLKGWKGAYVTNVLEEDEESGIEQYWLISQGKYGVLWQDVEDFQNTENILDNTAISWENPYDATLAFEYKYDGDSATTLRFYKGANSFSNGDFFDVYTFFSGSTYLTNGATQIKIRCGHYGMTLSFDSYSNDSRTVFFVYDRENNKLYINSVEYTVTSSEKLHKDNISDFDNYITVLHQAAYLTLGAGSSDKSITLNSYGQMLQSVAFSFDTTGIYIKNLRLYPSGSNLKKNYETKVTQTARMYSIAAENFNEDGSVKSGSEIFVKPTGSGIVTYSANGNSGVLSLTQENEKSTLNLKTNALIIESDNFKVDESGNVTAKNGSFSGKITADSGTIGKFTIQSSDDGGGLSYKTDDYEVVFDNKKFELSKEYTYIGVKSESRKFSVSGDDNIAYNPILTIEQYSSTYTADPYTPMVLFACSGYAKKAVKIQGGTLDCEGGILERAGFLFITESNQTNVIDIKKSCIWVVKSEMSDDQSLFLPSENTVRSFLQLEEASKFALPVEIHCHKDSNSLDVYLANDSNSNVQNGLVNAGGSSFNLHNMSKGDTARFLLIHDGTSYYAQLVGSLS